MLQTEDPLRSLAAFIGDKKILLVLDNCEHVIDIAAMLAERVVSEASQAHVLTTSPKLSRSKVNMSTCFMHSTAHPKIGA